MSESPVDDAIAAARRAAPAWSVGRHQQVRWAVMARLESVSRWRRPALLLAISGCVATALMGVVGWRTLAALVGRGPLASTAPTAGPMSPPAERVLPRLADGSSIVLDGPTAILRKTVETPEEVAFQLEAGGAHFEVARRPSRIFRVHAGAVTVQVIGTRFHVQRQQAGARVSVDRGRVLVSWWGGSRELGVGEEGSFPPEDNGAAAVPDTTAAATESPPAAAVQPPYGSARTIQAQAVHPSVSTRHERASNATPAAPAVAAPAAARPDVLFRRADRARASGNAAEAVTQLREILNRYRDDPHAPMAAFTIGRLQLESLGHPSDAALAFAQARALAHGGALAEDALAREVQALHTAGDDGGARRRAELYVQLFPNGPRMKTVTRFGGLRSAP